jgi:thioredoxin-related protein
MCTAIKVGPWKCLGFAGIIAMSAVLAIAQEPAKAPGEKAPTGSAKRASIYDKTADANVQLTKAVERATHNDKRVLLMFGGDWCGWCHKLHGVFKNDEAVRQILFNEYELVTIDVESPNAAPLLTTCKEALSQDELKKGVGYPFLAVLNAEGKVVTALRTDVLEDGDHHDPKRVASFLDKWKVPPKDAKRVLDEALSRASSDDKRVFLTFGAPWCGWCHRLHDWMARPEIATVLDRDFVIARVDIDRMTGGKDVQARYQPKTSGGIPWFAILDARGKPLATSDGPRGNIGYPGEPAGIDHFLKVVKAQGRRIDDHQLAELRKSLEGAAEEIAKKSRR